MSRTPKHGPKSEVFEELGTMSVIGIVSKEARKSRNLEEAKKYLACAAGFPVMVPARSV